MKIVECPRDAMQGITDFIPTGKKIAYLNQVMKVGFDTIDFGSFVSAKAIPQLRDTVDVLKKLDLSTTQSKLLAIVANSRGADEAAHWSEITYLGFPLSISETFQLRNTNKSVAEALRTIEQIQNICKRNNKTLVAYISMGFGNPYGDPYELSIVEQFSTLLSELEVPIISLADTIGVSTATQIEYLFKTLIPKFPSIEFGAHLHSNPARTLERAEAAYLAGCQRFDCAIKGFGGCPMANDSLVGNLATETVLAYLHSKNDAPALNQNEFSRALLLAESIFPKG